MSFNKEYGGDLCKSHSARSEKEFCRVCPSKLNKKELENVYFTLLENNLDLKTTINSQREQIKILSTKVQRLTTLQKTYLGKEPKDCSGSKAVIDEQKECIADLKRSNQCLSEKVRQLNMRLCSAKQFLKRSPFQSTSRCNRCSTKNASMSALITKTSDTNLRRTVASSQYLVKDIVSSRSADNNGIVLHEKGVQYDFCDENKCRNHIEELQQKNEQLQETVTRLKEEYAAVTGRLEQQASAARAESVRARSERAMADERAAHARAEADAHARRAGDTQLRCDELSVELAIEKRKVLELETRLKAADMSSRIASVIETHLANVKIAKDHTMHGVREAKLLPETGHLYDNKLAVPSAPYKPTAAVRTKLPCTAPADDTFKNSDDSGYTEPNRSQEFEDTKASTYINQLLLEKIADLQNQVNNLKSFKNDYNKPQDYLYISQETKTQKEAIYKRPIDKQKIDENIISESSESVITEKKPISNNTTVVERVNCDGNSKVKTKNEASGLDNKIDEVKECMSSNKLDNKINRKTIIDKVVSKNNESFKSFKTRSKDKGEADTVFENRKLSLQSSRESLNAKSLVKTSSLDEGRINRDEVNINTRKILSTPNITSNDSKRTQVFQTNSYSVADEKVNVNIKENIQFKGHSIQNNIKENVYEANVEKTSNNTEENKKRDSDSSKGTYSIHRDDIANPTTEAKDENVKRNKDVNKYLYENSYRKDLTAVTQDKKYDGNGIKAKDKKVRRRKCSAAGDSRTYVKARDESPDSTDCEISSLSDLPSERDERFASSRSPGEERPTTTESRVTTTTDYGSLSEGELPWLRDETILSAGEIRSSYATTKSHSFPVTQSLPMEEALAAVEQELARCTDLMRVHAAL